MAKIKVDDLIYDNSGTDVTLDLTTAFDNLGKAIKIHHFEYNTRTGTAASADVNHFTWTTEFSPVDAANNSFVITASVPANGKSQDWTGYGLRFYGNTTKDFVSYGNFYADQYSGYMTTYGMHYHLGAGALPTSSNQTIYFRQYTANSEPDWFCPNSSDNSRLSAQTRAFLTITEYKN